MLTVTLDTRYHGWLRLEFDYSPTIVAVVRTLVNREYVPRERGGPYWRAPCLPDVLDALIAHCGSYMAPLDYDVLVACYPAPAPPQSAHAWAAARDARTRKARYGRKRKEGV